MAGATGIKPIVGMLRRGLITDLGLALGIGFAFGNFFWYGYHMPRTHARDNYYKNLEDTRAARQG